MKRLWILLGLLLPVAAIAEEEYHVFTNAKGQKVEASVIALRAGQVTIRRRGDGKEFTLPIIAALLTIIGYSLNDTIIVFDRIRENLRKHHRDPLMTIINTSVNQTLGRTLLTSLTTLMVVIILFALGGGIIHDFAFALIVGVLVGTYSSIFVASPILLAWQKRS